MSATCVHAVPGRVRLVMPALRHSDTIGRAMVARLGGVDGVRGVEVRPRSASLIVTFDSTMVAIADLLDLAGIEHAPPPPRRRRLASSARYWTVVVATAAANALVGQAVGSGIGLLRSR